MRKPLALTCETSLAEIERLAGRERDGRVRQRLWAMKFMAQGQSVSEVAERLDMGESTVRKWTHRFNAAGPDGLRDRPRSGQPPKLAPELVGAFKTRVAAGAQPDDGVCALRAQDLRRILAAEYAANYSLGGTYFLLHRLGFSSLVPRPQHPKADAAAQADFKKTSCRRR